jgi:hypothetical protein
MNDAVKLAVYNIYKQAGHRAALLKLAKDPIDKVEADAANLKNEASDLSSSVTKEYQRVVPKAARPVVENLAKSQLGNMYQGLDSGTRENIENAAGTISALRTGKGREQLVADTLGLKGDQNLIQEGSIPDMILQAGEEFVPGFKQVTNIARPVLKYAPEVAGKVVDKIQEATDPAFTREFMQQGMDREQALQKGEEIEKLIDRNEEEYQKTFGDPNSWESKILASGKSLEYAKRVGAQMRANAEAPRPKLEMQKQIPALPPDTSAINAYDKQRKQDAIEAKSYQAPAGYTQAPVPQVQAPAPQVQAPVPQVQAQPKSQMNSNADMRTVGRGTNYASLARQMGNGITAQQLQNYAKSNLGGSFRAGKSYDFNAIRNQIQQPKNSQITSMLTNLQKARSTQAPGGLTMKQQTSKFSPTAPAKPINIPALNSIPAYKPPKAPTP